MKEYKIRIDLDLKENEQFTPELMEGMLDTASMMLKKRSEELIEAVKNGEELPVMDCLRVTDQIIEN